MVMIMSMRKIYREIARKYGTTPKEVRTEIQKMIDDAYQNQVPRKGEIPTAEEFIRYCAQKVREEK